MTTLFVDTATSDGWKYGHDIPDVEQPYMVRLAWLLEDEDGARIGDACHLIRLPQPIKMATGAQQVTGISDRLLEAKGKSHSDVIDEFSYALGQASDIVAHNWVGHRLVLERSYRYLGLPTRFWPDEFDVMRKGTDVVRVAAMQPGRQWKWPSFNECCAAFLPAGYPHCVANGVFKASDDPIRDGNDRIQIVRIFYQQIIAAKLDGGDRR